MPAIPYQHTATSDKPWDAGEAIKALPNTCTAQELRQLFAWVDPKGNPDAKSSYKFAHHEVSDSGTVEAANIKGCQSAISVLNGGMGGASIPDADRQGVYNHVAKHLRDAGETPADLKRSAPLKGSAEIRSFAMPDLRAAAATDGGGNIIEGHAAVCNQTACIGGWFNEIIATGAFDQTDFTDVLMSVCNHDLMIPLARSRNNNANSTLQLQVDDQGLNTKATLDIENNADARAVYSAVSRGDLSGMSFIFSVQDEEWADLEDEMPTRTITAIAKVFEVSPVSMPAYTGTDISARDQRALESAARALESARSELESSKNEQEAREHQTREQLRQEEARKNEINLLRLRAEILARE
jgi:HK97 family phage prohead protease